jgi:HSP20 family molecular chaperone IbpA
LIAELVPYVAGTVKRPSIDVIEIDEAIIVTIEIPGINKEDIEIMGDLLNVSAKRAF